MNKNIIIGVAALGGILLVGALFSKTSQDSKENIKIEKGSDVVTLSEKIPAQIPIYPYTKVRNSTESSQNGKDYFSFSISAKATIAEVNDWYREALGQNGWRITGDENIAGYQIIKGENQNLYTSMQVANGDESGTVIISQQVQIRPTN
ncbi:MAG: hypothetical protein WC095_02405 [Candidatus Paceibacterota bacterium]